MSRRSKKRSIEPEVRAAQINAQAIVTSAEIQAKGVRGAARITVAGAVMGALVAGLCVVTNTAVAALPGVLIRPEPVTTTAGPTPAHASRTSDSADAMGLGALLGDLQGLARTIPRSIAGLVQVNIYVITASGRHPEWDGGVRRSANGPVCFAPRPRGKAGTDGIGGSRCAREVPVP